MNNKENNLIWIDAEFTGLDFFNNKIIEIAVLVTDSELNILDKGLNLIINQPDNILEDMDSWCINHFTESGLLEEIKKSSLTTKEAEKIILQYLKKYTVEGESPLCGNSISQDRKVLFREMPELDNYCHYRSVDVSTIKELARRWKPEILNNIENIKRDSHRALDDIEDSIEELRVYKKDFFGI